MLNDLYNATPKNTGAAAANYIINNTGNGYFDKNKTTLNLQIAISECDFSKNFYIINLCPYLKFLNNGSSKQAPNFFIENTINMNLHQLKNFVKNAINKFP